METINDIKWIALGQTYENIQGSKPQEIKQIKIREVEDEQTRSRQDAERMAAGMPIDAQLAIFFIRNLWDEVEKHKLATIADVTTKKVAELLSLLPPPYLEENKNFLDNKTAEIKQVALVAQNWLATLLGNSFAITISKSMLLKTISQPGCEGVRFYLCMKDFKEDQKDAEVPGILTLATVGVDCANKDLHYKYHPKDHNPKSVKDIPKVENVSFCSEYALTANRDLPKNLTGDDLEPYVLYQYSKLDPDAK